MIVFSKKNKVNLTYISFVKKKRESIHFQNNKIRVYIERKILSSKEYVT